jgi:flagellar hook-associated protein 1
VSGSLNSILSVARSGMLAQQRALQVTGNNIANASTPGYSRQRAEMVPALAITLPQGVLGTGVEVADVTRARDFLLDATLRRDVASFESSSFQERELLRIEAVLAEPSDAGLASALNAFWDSWSDLANNPSNSSARAVVASQGQQVVDFFNRAANSFGAIRADLIDSVQVSVSEANRLIGEIADLNGPISAATAAGQAAPDIEDRRDLLLDELAALTEITVSPRAIGGIGVSINGISVVEGTIASRLDATFVGGSFSIQTGEGLAVAIADGSIGGAQRLLEVDLPAVENDLDELARGIVQRANGIHTGGTTPLGTTNVLFFDDFGDAAVVGAQNLQLSDDVLASLDNLAAGSGGPGGEYQSGANDVALALAALRTDTTGGVLDGRSINDAYQELVTEIGVLAASAGSTSSGSEILVSAGVARRQSVSGVSTDEELVKIVQLQAAFSAAARIVSVVDEMYQTILSI